MSDNQQLIRTTTSLCPECLENISAEIIWDKDEDKIFMIKKCEKHGDFKDRLSSNPEDYIWQQSFTKEKGSTVDNSTQPIDERDRQKGCPYDCGLCTNHLSAPCICLIDLTNRCNLRCPICFANSAATGYIYEPTFEELVQIMQHFRNLKPVPPPLLQLSGGEPTMRKDLPEIIKKGKELGFVEVMLTTNGVKLAKSLEYTKKIKEAGTDTVYLSFDGVEPETWKKTRGVDLYGVKIQAIENCKEAGITVVLVPTIVNGVNDHEVTNIMNVAKKYAGTVMGITFQPVSLTGRISIEDLNSMRYTTSDLKEDINKATGGIIDKFYPIATTAKLTRLFSWFDDEPQFSMLSHQDCGFATIGVLDENENWQPIENYFDVDGLIDFSNETWDLVAKREIPKPSELLKMDFSRMPKMVRLLASFTDEMVNLSYRQIMKAYFLAGLSRYVRGDITKIVQNKDTFWSFMKMIFNPGLETVDEFWRAKNLMISSMHFQDAFNFDLERVRRCLVHYGVIDPDDPTKVREIPFCAMNTYHRPIIEERLAKRKEERSNEEIDREVNKLVQKFHRSDVQ